MKATRATTPVADRLHAKLVQQPNGCVEFVGTSSYGRIYDRHVDGKPRIVLAHRLEHLFLGDQLANMHDMISKHGHPREHLTHCPNGHAYTAANTATREGSIRACRECRRERKRRYLAKRAA